MIWTFLDKDPQIPLPPLKMSRFDFMILNDGLRFKKNEKTPKKCFPIFSFWDMVELTISIHPKKWKISQDQHFFLSSDFNENRYVSDDFKKKKIVVKKKK